MKAVSTQLRHILRARIIRNDLQPNSRMSEPEIAKAYNVSRQPVREAFITLVNEGLIEIRPQRGTYVKKIDYESVINGRFVREAVEADIALRIAKRPDKKLIDELRSQLKMQHKCKKGAADRFMDLDEQFHRTLAQAAGLPKVWEFLDAAKSQMDRVRYLTAGEFPTSKLIHQHELIVDRLEEGSGQGAQKAMRVHLREILQSLPRVIKRYPEYFDNTETLV